MQIQHSLNLKQATKVGLNNAPPDMTSGTTIFSPAAKRSARLFMDLRLRLSPDVRGGKEVYSHPFSLSLSLSLSPCPMPNRNPIRSLGALGIPIMSACR